MAWAVTVHKSQGLTFEKVIADLGRAFAPGQVYVALSRCTTFSGLTLKTLINQKAIKTDPKVLEFAQLETPGTLITEQLTTGKADFYYKKAREQFLLGSIQESFDYLKRSLKFRNDIDTTVFERFVVIQGTRLFDFKTKFQTTLRKLIEVKEDQESEADEHRREVKELKRELSTSTTRIARLETELNRIKTNLKRSNTILKSKNSETKSQKIEIERLKNLKWHEKLLGKK